MAQTKNIKIKVKVKVKVKEIQWRWKKKKFQKKERPTRFTFKRTHTATPRRQSNEISGFKTFNKKNKIKIVDVDIKYPGFESSIKEDLKKFFYSNKDGPYHIFHRLAPDRRGKKFGLVDNNFNIQVMITMINEKIKKLNEDLVKLNEDLEKVRKIPRELADHDILTVQQEAEKKLMEKMTSLTVTKMGRI